jgi:3-hydroxyisobutyrate dehydrogenase-like beta-hydroxyacid dehydrogenase
MPGPANTAGPTIGILYPGEMGSSLGKVLAGDGFRVVTTLEGRSSRTRRLCHEVGLSVLGSLREVVQSADIVFSLVPPARALGAAGHFAEAVRGLARPPLFIDANSISPVTAHQIADLLTGLDCVDAAFYGLASQLRSRGVLYLSGPRASQVADVLGRSLRVKVMGDVPGKASAMKSLLAGLNKGLVALFLEMSLLARESDLLNELLEAYREQYPGVMEVVERLLPTYPQHAGRRGQEMRELERTMQALDLQPCVVRGAREVITAVGRLGLAEQNGAQGTRKWSVPEVVEAIDAHAVLTGAGERGGVSPPVAPH